MNILKKYCEYKGLDFEILSKKDILILQDTIGYKIFHILRDIHQDRNCMKCKMARGCEHLKSVTELSMCDSIDSVLYDNKI